MKKKQEEMQHAQMQNAQMQNAQMQNAQMQNPQMQNAQMQNAQMQNRQMQNPQMQNRQMQNPQMQNRQMQNPQMQNRQMQNPQMQNRQMQNAQMQNPQMRQAQMQNMQMQNPQVQNAQMRQTQMQNAQMQNPQMQQQVNELQNKKKDKKKEKKSRKGLNVVQNTNQNPNPNPNANPDGNSYPDGNGEAPKVKPLGTAMKITLFFTIFTMIAGNYLFCAIKMAGKKGFLTESSVTGTENFVGFLIVVLVILTGFFMGSKEEKKSLRWLKSLMAWLPFWLVMEIVLILYPKLLVVKGVTDVKAWITGRMIGVAAALVLITIVLFSGVYNIVTRSKKRGLGNACLRLLTHPLQLLLFVLLAAAAFLMSGILHMAIFFIPITGITFSFTMNMTLYVVESLLTAGVAYVMVSYMRKKVLFWDSKKNTGESFENFLPLQLILAGVLLVINLGMLIPVFMTDRRLPRQDIQKNIDISVSLSETQLINGDLNNACYYMKQVQDKLAALHAYAEEDDYTLSQILDRNKEDVLIWEMYLSLTGSAEKLEQYVLTQNPYQDELKMLLLDWYSHQKSRDLTKQQKGYAEELVKECITTQYFTAEFPKLPKSKKEKDKLVQKLDDRYGFAAPYAESLEYLINVGKNGSVNNVGTMIDIANKYPEDITIQYLAGVLCAAGVTDSSGYLEDAKTIVNRFIELSKKDKKITKNELQQRKMKAVELLIKLKGYEEADSLIEEIDVSKNPALEEQLGILRLFCADKSGDADACYDTAEELIEDGMENVQVYYFYGVGALKQGKTEKMTEALEKAAELILDENLTGSQLVNAETSFYIMLEYAVVSDSASWTDYTYNYYGDMEDSEKEKLSGFLYDYMEALHAYYNQRDYEYALEKVDDVLEQREDLSFAWYLRGAILFNSEEFDESQESYEKAIELNADNPIFLYALANTLEANKDYKEAYNVSGKVKELVPLIDHEQDWYGLGVHNDNLYRWLAGQQEQDGGEE